MIGTIMFKGLVLMSLIRFFFLLLILLPTQGITGILVEPYLGYTSLKSSGTLKYTGIDADLEETTIKGPIYGARLGGGLSNFAAGIDFMKGSLDEEGDDSSMTNLGAFAMVSFLTFRLWGTYLFSSSRTVIVDDSNTEGELKGTGLKAGLGWSILPYLSLNLEYMTLNYTKEDIDEFSDLDVTEKGFLLSVSAPLVF